MNTDSNYYINQSNFPTKLVSGPVCVVGNEYYNGRIVDIKTCVQTVS